MNGWMARSYRFALGGLCFGALLTTGIASRADEPLNLVGTWKGIAQAVHIGANPYRAGDQSGPNFSSATIEFTFTKRSSRAIASAGSHPMASAPKP
jgi:hypothetical protein